MDSDVVQIRSQAQDNIRAYGRYCAQHEFTTALIDIVYELIISLRKQTDLANQQKKENARLTHKLSRYTMPTLHQERTRMGMRRQKSS